MAHSNRKFDLVIIGSGLAGATMARTVRDGDPNVSILMIEAGAAIGTPAGRHLLGVDEDDIRAAYRAKAKPALQSVYVSESETIHEPGTNLKPGIWSATGVGMQFDKLPGAALAHNIGGMGIHWTTACPTAYGDEVVSFIPETAWADATKRAQEFFTVCHQPIAPSKLNETLLSKLRDMFPSPVPDRVVQPMPMAGQTDESGIFRRASPATIFEPLLTGQDPNFTLRTGSLCTDLVCEDGRVTGLVLRDLDTGETDGVSGEIVVVAADAIRTPQLLWKSGIRPEALGTHLNEHTNLSGFTYLDPQKLGLSPDDFVPLTEEEPYFAGIWIPSRGNDQPIHGQLMGRVMEDQRYRMTLTLYMRTDLSEANRLAFSDDELDAFGMPMVTAHFQYSAVDVDFSRRAQAMIGTTFGDYDVDESVLLQPGNSLHYTGTVRMGERDDGKSVCDRDGKVWGFDNLFLAGNGVVPTALSCNCTLTAATLAVLTGDHINRRLAGRVANTEMVA